MHTNDIKICVIILISQLFCNFAAVETKILMNKMKTRHLFSIMFGCLTVLCVTSCLGDDDNNNNNPKTLTKAQIAQCYQAVAGSYTGNLYCWERSADGLSQKADTLDGSWNIPTDSTLIITDFPAQVIAGNVSNVAIREALAKAPNQTIKCQMIFLETSPIQFLVNPYNIEYTLEYGGSQHKVMVVFYVNNTYSFGMLDADTKKLMVKIIPAALYVDEQKTDYLYMQQAIFVSK